MQVIIYSSSLNIIDEFKAREVSISSVFCETIEEFNASISNFKPCIVVADYDSVANDINTLISSNTLPENTIILERTPQIATGKTLISHGIKAYGNLRMLNSHFIQMIDTVSNNKIWTYPELTIALANIAKKEILNSDSIELIKNKLTKKETEVILLILEGFTNDGIANKMDIKTRTVKSHVGSIFKKLHVSDRVSLVLLLK